MASTDDYIDRSSPQHFSKIVQIVPLMTLQVPPAQYEVEYQQGKDLQVQIGC